MKKYYAIGFIIVASALFAYHFYAAENAEENLDTAIQEITKKLDPPLSVSYSNIEVHPFSGDIHFQDLNIIRNRDIRRARSVHFDFSYFDFLNISLFGPEYGLKRINSGNVTFDRVSFTNRATLTEIKIDSLGANYRGELWQLLRIGFKDTLTTSEHSLSGKGTRFTFSMPENFGVIKADTLALNSSFSYRADEETLSGQFSLKDLTWNPTPSFSNKYRFFIQGFGYQADAIPFRHANAEFQYESANSLVSISDMTLDSELFTGSMAGELKIDSLSYSDSSIQEATIRIGDFAPQLQNFLSNAEKLFGINIPLTNNELSIKVSGTLEEPAFNLPGN